MHAAPHHATPADAPRNVIETRTAGELVLLPLPAIDEDGTEREFHLVCLDGDDQHMFVDRSTGELDQLQIARECRRLAKWYIELSVELEAQAIGLGQQEPKRQG